MKAIIYLRVSTEEQATSRLGIEAQLRDCEQVATRMNITESSVYRDEGISGSTRISERKGLTAALSNLNKGDVFIVAKRDRVARDMFIALTVEEFLKTRKASFISAAGEGSGTEINDVSSLIQRRMFDLFAEVEREMIRSRTKAALHSKKLKGERVGMVPYGYRLAEDSKHITPCQTEQEVIQLVKKLRQKGISTRRIATSLNKRRVASRTGNPWSRTQITRMLEKK